MNVPVFMSEQEAAALRRFVRERGEKAALSFLGVAPATLARAAAGLPVQRVTVGHLRWKMGELAAQKAA